MEKIRAAVIGLGRIGYLFSEDKLRTQPASHVGCYSCNPNVSKLAICDIDANIVTKATHSMLGLVEGYQSVYEMMRCFEPEVVSICTPTYNHEDMVMRVADYDCVKSIFLEKPIASSLEEADAIIDICRKKNIRLTINYTRRWTGLYPLAKGMVDSYGLGTMVGYHPGPIVRTGTHMIDVMNWMAGPCDMGDVQVTAFGHESVSDYMKGSDDININGLINYGDVQAVFFGEKRPYLMFELDMLCDNGRVQLLNNGEFLTIGKKDKSSRYTNINELAFNQTMTESYCNTPLLNAVEETVNYDVSRNSCTGQDARDALHVALALHYSAKTKQPVTLRKLPSDYQVRSR